MKNILYQKRNGLLFLVILVGIGLFYDFHHVFHLPPHSTHVWRQTDGASIAYRYYQDDMNFFRPKMINVFRSDGNNVGEFPILYYLAAVAYQIFGFKEGILRLLSLLCVYLGLFALYKLSFKVTQDLVLALSFPILIFSSPVFVFYSFNFLPDAPAFGLSIFGLYAFYNFYQTAAKKWQWISFFFFLIAGLIKVTSLIGLVAILIIWIAEKLSIPPFKTSENRFPKQWTSVLLFGSIFIIVAIWLAWARQYGLRHESAYLLSRTMPIWDISTGMIQHIANKIYNILAERYFHPIVHLLTIGISIFMLSRFKKIPHKLYAFVALCFMGCLSIFLIWYQQFEHHDYYVINLILFPVVIGLSFLYYLKKHHLKILNNPVFKIGFLALTILSCFHARKEQMIRYEPHGKYYAYHALMQSDQLQSWLLEHGVQQDDKVISVPDASPNITLYYLKRRGWTEYNNFIGWNKYSNGNQYTKETIEDLISKGAKYLVVHDPKYLELPAFKAFTNKPIGVYENAAYFYELQ